LKVYKDKMSEMEAEIATLKSEKQKLREQMEDTHIVNEQLVKELAYYHERDV